MKKYLATFFVLSSLALAARADTTLVFNEIMYHPAGNEPTNEWVELYNQLAVDLDISNWRLGGDIDFTFPNNTRVPGRGFIVVAINPAALMAATGLNGVYGPFLHRLNNGSGTLRIYNNANRLIDELQYGVDGDWPVPPDGSGVSLAKRDRDFGSGKAANWTWSTQVGGTPGVENFALASNVRLFAVDAAWRYEASGTDLGTAWRQPGYNDSLWSSRHFLTNSAVPNLFNTGVGNNKVVLPVNTPDPHYIFTVAAEGTVGSPANAIANNAAWVGNDLNSLWVGIRDGAQNSAGGNYSYRTGFSLDGFILPTVQINFVVAVDDVLNSVFLNGVDKNITHTGFATYSPTFSLTGFTGGSNTLDFNTSNGGANPGGFRVVYTSSGLGLNTNGAPAINNSTYYFRKSFTFNDDPRYASLTINPVLADGAVVYLNGVEVYRQNMPAGAPNYSTAALSNAVINYAGVIPISASNLVAGANVLAVEVHQATGSPDGPVIGMELTYSQSPAPPVTLAFNEFNGTTNNPSWVELMNYGTNSFDLGGMQIRYDGTNDENYVIPSGTILNAGQFLVLTNSTLGFTQWQSGDKLTLISSNSAAVYESVVLKKAPRARYPDGTGAWLSPSTPIPGANNNFFFRDEIVINEIMYHHKAQPPGTNGFPPKENAEAWIELYNRNANAVDLTGWKISGGVNYSFRPGQIMAPHSYLVIADNYDSFHATYPAVDAVGNLGGRLSGSNDRIVLEDPSGNPADEVHYYSDGRWPEYADGGGSSLELRDPNADNSKAEAWAASEESSKSGWVTYTYRMTAAPSATANPDTVWREFVLGLLAGGECLIDDVSLIQNPTTSPVQFLTNGNFENGITGWRVLGNHGRSFVEPEPGNPGNKVLHLVASGAQEHMHNHIETTFISGLGGIVNGTLYEISYRAKWLAGNHLLNTRAYFNRLARTTALTYPENNGTPGAQNSRYATNVGPTYANFAHSPMVPQVNQAVTVSVQAQDPQNVTNCTVYYSVNGGSWATSLMTLQNGTYRGTIPGQAGNALVQFYVQGTDGAGAISTFPAAGPNSGAFYRVFDNAAILAPLHNMRILMSPANTALLHASTNVMSNETLPATLIYDERIAYYDIGVRLKSSERGRDNSARVGFHIEFQPDQLFRGAHPVMLIDRSNGGSRPANEEIILRHMLLHAGVPAVNPDLCRVLSPRASEYGTGILAPRFEDEFVDNQYEDGGEGTLFELELIYYPTSANAQGYKLPQPDAVQGLDYSDQGATNKEPYRYNFIIKNHREADDYTRFIPFARTFSLTGVQLDQQTRLLMDMNQWARAYGMVSLCGVGDMYTFGNNHNFMTYLRAGDQKMLYFPWDMDFSFNSGTSSALVGDQNLGKIMNLPANFRRMLTHMQQMISTTYNTNYMAYWIGHYGAMAGQNYSADNGYIQSRGTFALSQIPVANYAVNGTNFVNTGSNMIVLTGTAPIQIKTITINGVEYPITWTSATAWSITVPLNAASNTLNVTFSDLNGLALSNITRVVNVTNAVPDPRGSVVFNEIMYNPLVPDSGYVELFNNSFTTAFDLSGWRINGLDFTFPGTVLGPRQFAVVAASTVAYAGTYGLAGGAPVGEFGGNLQNDGEMLTLIKPAASSNDVDVIVDRVRYEAVTPWPANANGTGASIQVIDPNQENARVGNWTTVSTVPTTNDGWRFVSATGTTPGGNITNLMRLCTYIGEIGSALIDDVMLVPGTVAGVGTNYVINGDFEGPLTNGTYTFTNGTVAPTGWTFGTNYSNSVIVADLVHTGAGALKEIGTFPGSILQPNFVRSINQILAPPPLTNAIHTMSFWYWATNSATNLHVRIINSGGLSAAPGNNPTNINITVTPPSIPYSPNSNNVVATALPLFAPLWLNEVQAENVSGVTDGNGEHEPWVEIYNESTNTVSLEGLYLSHNYANPTNWAFPAGASIGPTQFLIVFCDGEAGETTGSEYHTSFRLPAASGSIALARLYNDKPQVLDYINYAGLHSDRSYGSFPDGQPFERYEFFYVTPRGTNDGRSAPLTVFVNEWLASNVGSLADPADSDFDDWFEIYNPTTNTVDLAGYYLTDTATNKTKFLVTTNMAHTIPPLGHLLVWADNETGQNLSNGVPRPDLHVNFQLAKGGEALGIYAADGTLIDLVTFGPQVDDVTEGRYPDGAAYITSMPGTASPRAANYVTGGGNTPPTLNPIGNKVLYFGQTLTFTATATDSDLPAQSLNYFLEAGAPAGATIGNGSGIFSWTPAGVGSSTFNVRVTDSGAPPLSDFESITVEVLPAPSFTQSVRNGANLELSWGTRAGKKYAVDATANLNPPIVWIPLQTNTAVGSTMSYTNTTTNGVQSFFRVRNIE